MRYIQICFNLSHYLNKLDAEYAKSDTITALFFEGNLIEILSNDLLKLEDILSRIRFEQNKSYTESSKETSEVVIILNGSINDIRIHLKAIYLESLTPSNTFYTLSNRIRNFLRILKLLAEHLEALSPTRNVEILQSQPLFNVLIENLKKLAECLQNIHKDIRFKTLETIIIGLSQSIAVFANEVFEKVFMTSTRCVTFS